MQNEAPCSKLQGIKSGILRSQQPSFAKATEGSLSPSSQRQASGYSAKENKPNFQNAKMNTSLVKTRNYNNELRTMNYELLCNQTQPVVSLSALSFVEVSNLFQTQHLSEPFLFFTFLGASYNLAMQNWTIQKLLNWATEHFTDKGVDSPRLSAELLLSHVVGLKRIELYTQFDKRVDKQQLDRLHDLVKRAGKNEPIAYLTGKTEFSSLELNVSPDCMIPRPETELLVERAIEFLRTRPVRNSTMRNMIQTPLETPKKSLTGQKGEISNGGTQFICDLCTGSGCVAVAIARNCPNARIIATDISDAALNIAAQNIEKHQLGDRIKLLCGDLFDPIMPQLDAGKFDLIVCNPPYVSITEFDKLDKNIKDYEPKLALLAGDEGLDIHRRVIEKADQFLKPDAALMLEIGFTQGRTIKELLEQTETFAEITIEKDLYDNDRIAIAKKQENQ